MRVAVGCFDRVHKYHNNPTVRRWRANASGGGAGSGQDAGTTPTTATTRLAHNAPGVSATQITGANIGTRTRNTATATALNSVCATCAGANA